jgi:Undecaprenyl-phosphate glucose phosphotransferase
MAIFDLAWIVSASVGAGVVYHATVIGSLGDHLQYFGSGIAVAALFCTSARAYDLYQPSILIHPQPKIRNALAIWVFVFLLLAAVAFTLKISELFSRGTALLFFVAGAVGIVASRIIVARVLTNIIASGSLGGRRIALLISADTSQPQHEIEKELQRYGYAVPRIFKLGYAESDASHRAKAVEGVREILRYVRNRQVDEIIVALPWSNAALIDNVASELRALPTPVKLMPDPIVARFLEHPIVDLGPAKVIELQRAPLTNMQRALKRTMDVVMATLGMIVLAPLFVLIAIVIRLETPGPAFFIQIRVGFNGHTFRIYKFRTMTTLENGTVVQQARRNDPRITKVGRFLRRYSLDELPQLLNVLRGEMSLVGPRPHALAHDNEYDKLIASYATRQKMKPGVTGLAQVNGCRGETPEVSMMQHRVEYDLNYIDRWSLWLDVRILARTLLQILRPRNVY